MGQRTEARSVSPYPGLFTLRGFGHEIAQVLHFARPDFHVFGDGASDHKVLDEIKRVSLAWNQADDFEPAVVADLGKSFSSKNRLKLCLAPRFALGVDDPARQNSPGKEGDRLRSGFVS